MNRVFGAALLFLSGPLVAQSPPWPAGVVSYQFDPSVGAEKAAVVRAFGLWCHRGVDMEFREVGGGWLSSVAWAWGLDRSVMVRIDRTLGVFARTTLGAGTHRELVFNPDLTSPDWLEADLAHEWGHVLGLPHEHQRWDRDRFVAFPPGFLEGLPADRSPDYRLTDDPRPGRDRPYDYGSLMHYSSNIDGNRMVRRDTGALIPGARAPSPGDLKRLVVLGFSPQESP